jgi:hypothetical protein
VPNITHKLNPPVTVHVACAATVPPTSGGHTGESVASTPSGTACPLTTPASLMLTVRVKDVKSVAWGVEGLEV